MRRIGSPRTLLLAAFGAAQALDDLIQPSIPSAELAERVRVGVPFMAAFAFQNQRVLSELVAQFLDLEFAGHGAIVAALGPARPSSIRRPPVLCKLEFVSSSGALVRTHQLVGSEIGPGAGCESMIRVQA
jgi:hypothetical protein